MAASCVLCGVDDSPAAANVVSVAAPLRERLGLDLRRNQIAVRYRGQHWRPNKPETATGRSR